MKSKVEALRKPEALSEQEFLLMGVSKTDVPIWHNELDRWQAEPSGARNSFFANALLDIELCPYLQCK